MNLVERSKSSVRHGILSMQFKREKICVNIEFGGEHTSGVVGVSDGETIAGQFVAISSC